MKEANIKCKVLSNNEIAKNIYEITLQGNISGIPGQFYMVRAWEGLDPFLSRPLSISDIEGDIIHFVYEVKGKGTKELSSMKTNEVVQLTGPLGNGFIIKENMRSAVVSGGIGIAPMIYLLKQNHKMMDMFAGFRAEPYLIDVCNAH
ncbi:dihydroorotate dehydrogenase electron transfer subunit, partial [Vibrio parahaemolyticus]|nr:dihydroorotate dehydrogenase electron transfer subunit [Vibrio parahaemolyticus]